MASDAVRSDVVRSEEEAQFGVRRVPTARYRVGKRIVTEDQTFTVAVRREELFVEELPLDGNPTPAGEDARGVIELVLRREEVTIRTDVVPVERVRVTRHVEAASAVAGAQVRAERIDVRAADARDAPGEGNDVGPIAGYDRLRAAEIHPLLAHLGRGDLDEVERRERAGKSRVTVLRRIERLRSERT